MIRYVNVDNILLREYIVFKGGGYMLLYHGSENIIEKSIYGYGKKYNDYGIGFYCTEDMGMAKEWAVDIDRNGYVNSYELDNNGLTILNLCDKKYSMLHWLAVLLENRTFHSPSPLASEAKQYITEHFLIPYERYDIITGYRADDSYFSFAQDFINGVISYRQLSNAMYLGKLGEQVVLKSKKAFEQIHFLNAEEVSRDVWYAKKASRDKKARREYFDIERNKRQKGDLYIMQIMDEEMRADDLRLR